MIVHIITGLSRGGAENVLYRLLSRDPDPGQVQVVSLTDEGVFGARLRALGVGVTCLHLHPRLPAPTKFLRLVRLLRQWQPQLVQTWMYHADLIGGVAAKIVGIPVCWGVRHTDLSVQHNKTATRWAAHMCALVSRWVPSRIISCSERAVEVHRKRGYAAPFSVVPNGLDVSTWSPRPNMRKEIRERLRVPEGAFLFAHAGRADPQKDHAGLVQSFNLVQAREPRAWLLLCGEGLARGDQYLEALPFTAQSRQQTVTLGARDDLADLWQAGDAFVLSSSFGEAFPNVVAEAMACCLPCIVTDVGDASLIVGDTGFVVPPCDVQRLAQSMSDMMRMPELERQKLGRKARERIEDQFTLEKMAKGFRSVWGEVLALG